MTNDLHTAYELTGVTDEGREAVLSYNADDPGNIDMRIGSAEPLYTADAVGIIMHEVQDEEIEEGQSRAFKMGFATALNFLTQKLDLDTYYKPTEQGLEPSKERPDSE